jgi:hypothetical protein
VRGTVDFDDVGYGHLWPIPDFRGSRLDRGRTDADRFVQSPDEREQLFGNGALSTKPEENKRCEML